MEREFIRQGKEIKSPNDVIGLGFPIKQKNHREKDNRFKAEVEESNHYNNFIKTLTLCTFNTNVLNESVNSAAVERYFYELTSMKDNSNLINQIIPGTEVLKKL